MPMEGIVDMVPEDFSPKEPENVEDDLDVMELSQEDDPEQEETREEEERELTELDYTRIQMEAMLRDAAREAEEILEQAREAAKIEAENVYQAARDAGRQEGYQEGLLQAMEEGRLRQEQEAAQMTADVQDFLERASTALDRQLDENINELRDLAIAIAEKVVCISLRSSTEIIGRMVQAALDKRKQREWIHIYISESDAKRMSQVPASLASALSGISNRVRIIPMADDDSGTCVIEMPDEIIDASASTQLSNIRSMLMNGRQAETDFGSFEF
ncbi:MAG: F0F1 ATP synthase subunit delta [Oscillospiraceae bacterium]|nr:F0F1 ATP synthase subunit delta [Oscillospiraceae bacterium]